MLKCTIFFVLYIFVEVWAQQTIAVTCPLKKHHSVEYRCLVIGDVVGSRVCHEEEPVGTMVSPLCLKPHFYSTSNNLAFMHCREDGTWDHVAKCTPAAASSVSNSTLKSIPLVEALLLRLEAEQWPDDAACRETTLNMLYGVKNDTLWATWVWDSMQLPVGVFYGSGVNLGSYDQCLKTPWSDPGLSTQYCLVEVKVQQLLETREFGPMDSADEYRNTLTKDGRIFNELTFGACIPAGCSPSSVARFYKHLLQLTHIADATLVEVHPQDCQRNEEEPYSKGFYIFMSVVATLVGMVAMSTIYSYFNERNEKSTFDAIACSFCIVRNWGDLFKQSSEDIKVIHGMRFFTAMAVVACHQGLLIFVHNPSLVINTLYVDKLVTTEFGQFMAHIDLAVDTFFAFSGLLLTKSLLSGRRKNLLLVLLKRYFRLMAPYAALTFYILFVIHHTGRGPIWLRCITLEQGVCEKHWWKNFFMMGTDIKTLCYGLAWYVSCDYHLSILTVLLFWIYRKNRSSGISAFAAVSVILTIQLAVKSYWKGLPLTPFENVTVLKNMREYQVLNEYYIKWHDRAGSYLVGIAMGWLMTTYKPAEHRHTFDKYSSYVIVLCSVYAMLKMLMINNWLTVDSPAVIAIAIATSRAVWAAAVCAVVIAVEYGTVPIIGDFLGSRFFVPLSRLSYGIYMTHLFVLQRSLHGIRTPIFYDIYTLIIFLLGAMVAATGTSLMLYVLVEAPCVNLSNLFLSERRLEPASIKPMDGSAHQNGHSTVYKQHAKAKVS